MSAVAAEIETGLLVRVARLGDTPAGRVADRFVAARLPAGAVGVVGSWVPGTDEQLWYVHHDLDGKIGAYWVWELEPDEDG